MKARRARIEVEIDVRVRDRGKRRVLPRREVLLPVVLVDLLLRLPLEPLRSPARTSDDDGDERHDREREHARSALRAKRDGSSRVQDPGRVAIVPGEEPHRDRR